MTNNCLIYETLNNIKDMKVVSKKDGFMTLSGVFGVCGVKNNNQRVYEASNYSKMIVEMKERIKADGGIPGELEHPAVMNITLENISHKITEIDIDENGVVTGTVMLLNTPKGQIAQAIVEGGLPLHISSRATGAVDSKTGNVTLERIATYDLVGTPGFSQARLNLNENQIAESINESAVFYITDKTNVNENNEQHMENLETKFKEIMERLDSLQAEVKDLREENENLRDQLNQVNESIPTISQDELIKHIANGTQNWFINECTPMIQEYINEYFDNTDNKEYIDESIEELREWVANDFCDQVENWTVNEFSNSIQQWMVNECAPAIQSWVIDEYTPTFEQWLNESYTVDINNNIDKKITESKKFSLSSIDETLKLLENIEVQKPNYTRVITENNEPKFIQDMPSDVRVKWNMASEEIRESVMRRAKLYNFANEGAIERFWSNIDLDEIKPTKNIYEGLSDIEDSRERDIRARIRASRLRKY